MKKYKGLFRCQLGGYAIWLFGVMFMPFMFIKVHAALVVVLAVIACLILAGEIVAQVFFSKDRKKYVPVSFASHGLASLFVLVGFIYELILAISGQLGLYAMIIFSVCVVFYALIDIFLVIINKKVIDGSIDKDKFER